MMKYWNGFCDLSKNIGPVAQNDTVLRKFCSIKIYKA